MSRAVTVVRVFTRGDAGGNHLGIVTDLHGLDDTSMQAIAFELGYSETVFIEQTPGNPPHVRIFTPANELPFAGHPLVGSAWYLRNLVPGATDRVTYRQGTARIGSQDGVTSVTVALDGEMAVPGDVEGFLDRAGIKGVESVSRVMQPLEYVVARLASARSVAGLVPDMAVLAERFGTFVYARDGSRVRARFFAPGTAVPEDPATGSAAVALAIALADEGENSGELIVDQGEEIGRPSRINLAWSGGSASIGGTVVHEQVLTVEI